MFAAVDQRLKDIMALAGRIRPAASLSELMARGQAPQVCPAAYVLPLGIRGGLFNAMANLIVQDIVETLGIVLFLRSAGDATGGQLTDQLIPLRNAVIRAIVGWAPQSDWLEAETVGVFRLARGELISLSAGLLIYQLDFALDDQLRI
ncbi:hypothetical protein OVY48_09885 [Sphingobium sp. SA2]|uniref:phage tail terminator protein n=1 Tax=Sphingobium sp. SA2 TaxID=1524832 RepID=UPI0028C1F50D|nr:hypothetical protein [Sphingobium sp. SA2]MDT7533733.1 hypothetical protein [Sphingobium sp. SA2]